MMPMVPSAEETAALGRRFIVVLINGDPAIFRKIVVPSFRMRVAPRSINCPDLGLEEFPGV